MQKLYQLIGERQMDTLLCDYLVFIKENDQSLNYLQICGKSIAELFEKK